MPDHGPEALRTYLLKIDDRLEAPARIILIGGGAIALAHDARYATLDLDTYESRREHAFWSAVEALKDDAEAIPVQEVAVGDAPHDYADRLRRLPLPGATRLTVLIPEAHDLAIMKALRGTEHDLAGIEAIHRSQSLSTDTLIERFWACTHAVGEPGRLRLTFVMTLERLFGTGVADRAERELATWPDRRG